MPNVLLPEEIFDDINTLVLNPDTFAQEYPNLDIGALFPRVRANAAENAEEIHSRPLMYLPARFASLVIDNK